jgi:hypothetical protein
MENILLTVLSGASCDLTSFLSGSLSLSEETENINTTIYQSISVSYTLGPRLPLLMSLCFNGWLAFHLEFYREQRMNPNV